MFEGGIKLKIGILGGTFDPPHLGHLIMANEVLCSLELDEIWFMPNQDPPHKEKARNVSNENRLAMLNLAIAGHPNFKIETIEFERAGRSYTYDSIILLKEKYPTAKFYFIIGGDMVEYLPKWHRIEELVDIVQFVGVNRPSYRVQTPYAIQSVEIPSISISSSLIRKRMKDGKTIRYLVPDSVRKYMEENQLYES